MALKVDGQFLVKTKYYDGDLAVGYIENETGYLECLSVNLPESFFLDEDQTFFDINIYQGDKLFLEFIENSWIIPTGETVQSGFIEYPAVKWTILNEIPDVTNRDLWEVMSDLREKDLVA